MKNVKLFRSVGLVGLLCFGGAIGCSDMESVTPAEAVDIVNSGKSVATPEIPSCQVDTTEYQLDVNLNSLEIQDRRGIGFGFNFVEGFLKALGFNFKTEKGYMTMYMGLSESADPFDRVGYVQGGARMKKNEFRFNIDIGLLAADFNYFKQTPLNELTGKATRSTLYNLDQELKTNGVRWTSRVAYVNEGEQSIVIPVGNVAKVHAGDRFHVYNVNYIWEGEPCESDLLLPEKTTSEPLALVEAIQVENNATRVRIIEKNYEEPIQVGAMVEIETLVANTDGRRYLDRPVKVRSVTSQPLPILNTQGLDLKPYVHENVRAWMDLYGFQPRN